MGTSYNAAKMSSRFHPDALQGTGIFLRDPSNSFGDWNRVFLPYCSSDSWSGQVSDAVLTNPDDPSQGYQLHFRGADIVDGVFEAFVGGLPDPDGGELMPDITQATDILFVGSSAGSGGTLRASARTHAHPRVQPQRGGLVATSAAWDHRFFGNFRPDFSTTCVSARSSCRQPNRILEAKKLASTIPDAGSHGRGRA